MCAYTAVPSPITAKWLTVMLRQAGALQHGEVSTVEQDMTGAFNSRTSRLVLSYSVDASSGAPPSMYLKQNTPEDWAIAAGAEEVRFYNLIASLPDHPPGIVPCYAAAYDAQSGESYLLLRDISETNCPPLMRDQQINIVDGVPRTAYIEAVVDTLAQLHAYWWDHSFFGTQTFDVGYWSRNAERFNLYLRRRRNAWQKLITNEQAWFPNDLRDLYEWVFACLPQHWARYLEPRFHAMTNLTLVHGDAYFANFMCPKHSTSGATYLLDWQSPSCDIAGHDLANLIAAFWTSEQRHTDGRELNMLRRYHTGLIQHGVAGYSWDDLLTDYRTGLIYWLLMPVQDGADRSGKDYWWPKMQCLVAAFRDWRCEEMLDM